MTMPNWREWLFSAKTFAASMLALYAAMALGMPRPYWAMATVYVVSNPLTGATRSKGVYRAGGTLLGASAAVLLVPWLVDRPLLLSLAVSLWTGGLLYLALLDRTPRNYLFMLAAYSLPLIALPAVSAPDQVFDIAVSRTQEIGLAIVCASVVAAVVLPGRVAPVLALRVHAWLGHAAAWAGHALAPTPGQDRLPPVGRHQLAADILALDQLISQLSYDAAHRGAVSLARELRWRLSLLLPALSSVQAALQDLHERSPGLCREIDAVLQEAAAWLRTQSEEAAPRDALLQRLAQASHALGTAADWDRVLARHVLMRLQSLVWLWQDCLALGAQMALEAPRPGWQPAYRRERLDLHARHYDHGMLAYSALSAIALIFLTCLLWIQGGWADGASAVIMGAIAACFFAAQDEPAPAQFGFLLWSSVCMVLGAVLLFYAIPATHDFETLALVLAPPFLLVGTLANRPGFTMMAMTLTVAMASQLGLSQAYNADFTSYLNSNLASIAGIMAALLWTLLTRPFGAGLALRRLVHASWADLVRCAAGRQQGRHGELAAVMLDRLSLLLPRLAASPGERLTDGFSELRVGFSVLDLQSGEAALEGPARAAVQDSLQSVEQHYAARLQGLAPGTDPGGLGERIDRAIALLVPDGSPAAAEALNALAELRLTLCPRRPAWALQAGAAS